MTTGVEEPAGPRHGYAAAGLLLGGLLWLLSEAALGMAMRQNWLAAELARVHTLGAAHALPDSLRRVAVVWSLGFTSLQILSLLTFAFALRAFWHWRTAVCYSVGAALVLCGDALGLVGLLVWLRVTAGDA